MADVTTLIAALPAGMVVTDPDILGAYRQDRAQDPSAGTPLALVRPLTTGDVQATVRWCAEHAVPITTRGAGTSLSGGATAVDGALMITTEKMRGVTVDTATRTAVCAPGMFNAEVKAAAAEHNLWYPPDPSSFEICTIGGNAATNAGGLCCVKYGVTVDYVLGLEVVLADGRAVRLGGKQLKDSAGLSLTRLFVGSEGLLGIITEVTVRLLPPQAPASTVVGVFPSVRQASEAVVAVTAQTRPAMLEFMDHTSINAVEDVLKMGLDRGAGAMLIAQSDAPGPAGSAEIGLIETAFRDCGADEARRAQAAFDEIMGLAVEMGGTITGEHGVGRLKKSWLPAQLGDDVMDLTATIKSALDPQGLLNPGVLL